MKLWQLLSTLYKINRGVHTATDKLMIFFVSKKRTLRNKMNI